MEIAMELGTISNVAASTTQRTVDSGQLNATPVSTPSNQTTVQTANAVQQAATPPSMDQVKQAVDEINKSAQYNSRGLEFSVDDESERTIVKVIDKQTKDVIRQIPSEEALAIAQSLDQAIGNFVKNQA
jgi:flagellar protein FlaG